MLDQITPVILTLNEAPNVGRTLEKLDWAAGIVVVDSHSSDETLAILARFPKVRIYSRRFDTLAAQWRFAVDETAIASPWILRMDADYLMSDALIAELASLSPPANVSAYDIGFDYAVHGRKLRSSLYPDRPILLRKDRYRVEDVGHKDVWTFAGDIGVLKARMAHDDRKSLRHWLAAQGAYMELEAERLNTTPKGLRDWLRLHPPLMPFLAFFYCLFGRGLILDGRAGLFYALQRLAAEAILSLKVIEKKLNHFDPGKPPLEGSNP